MRQTRRHGSERAQQRSDVPKRQHLGRHEDNKRQDHKTNTPFQFHHSQGNNKSWIEAQVYCAHEAKEEQTQVESKSVSGDSQEVIQKGTYMEFDF